MSDDSAAALSAVIEAFDEAHHFWHRCADSYHDPVRFRTNLNALIQAARNTTFRMQSHKGAFPDFEDWYTGWQAFLKADPVMKWASEARTEVTKRRGLVANSRARAQAIWSYGPAATVPELDVPPETSTPEIIAALLSSVPPQLGENVLVEITREWQFDELPGKEVLAAMRDVIHVLAAMISDLHRLLQAQPIPPLLSVQNEPVVDCMADVSAVTTVRINPATGATYTAMSKQIMPDPTVVGKIAERYGPLDIEELKDESDVDAFCQSLLQVGKSVLKRDKHHVPVLFFRDTDGRWVISTFVVEDRLDKFIMWHRMADEVRRKSYDAFVLVTESWYAEPKSVFREGKLPDNFSKVKGRREALTVQYETLSGDRGLWVAPFRRRFGKIVFEETEFTELSSVGGFPEPIRAVWRARGGSAEQASERADDSPSE